jgi:hypothetical protein
VSSNVDWISNITIQQHNTSDKYYDVKFKVAQNSVTSSRSGKITFTYNDQEAYLNVVQAAGEDTGYTLYLYDPSNLNMHFSYYRLNGRNNVQPIPSGKFLQIYTYSPSTENNTIIIEL